MPSLANLSPLYKHKSGNVISVIENSAVKLSQENHVWYRHHGHGSTVEHAWGLCIGTISQWDYELAMHHRV